MKTQLTAVYEKHGKSYIAYLEEIPGINTQGKTKDEAYRNLKDALGVFLEANRQLAHLRISGKSNVITETFALIRDPVV